MLHMSSLSAKTIKNVPNSDEFARTAIAHIANDL